MLKNSKMLYVSLSFDRLRTGWLSLTLSLKPSVTLSLSKGDIHINITLSLIEV
jgi:hypothetical protein